MLLLGRLIQRPYIPLRSLLKRARHGLAAGVRRGKSVETIAAISLVIGGYKEPHKHCSAKGTMRMQMTWKEFKEPLTDPRFILPIWDFTCDRKYVPVEVGVNQ